MEIYVLAGVILLLVGVGSFFMLKLMDENRDLSRIIATMVKEDYKADPGILNEMSLDVSRDKEPDASLIDTSEMTTEDLADLTD